MVTLTQLNRTIRSGDEDRALAMIAPGDWLDGVDSDAGDTALTASVTARSVVLVEALLRAGAKLESRSRSRETPLHRASALGDAEIARRLIDAGADVHARTLSTNTDIDSGQTVLIKAVVGKALPIVKMLIEKGADPLAKDDFGASALSLAQEGRKQIAAYLSKCLNTASHGTTLSVYDAVRTKALELLQALVSQGVPLDVPEPDSGLTPLHLAAKAAWLSGVEFLLGCGVAVDAQDKDGLTPLMSIGAGKAAVDVAQALLRAGANVNAQTPDGASPLQCANDAALVKALLAAGADPNLRHPVAGHTVFLYTCLFDPPEILAAMIEAGADLDATDASGRGIEFYAKSSRRARALINERRGAPMSAADRLREQLKTLPTRATDPEFLTFAERLGLAFNRKPAPWQKRKGALYFHDVSLARVYAFFGETLTVSDDQRVHEAILARLTSEAREHGVTLFHLDQLEDLGRKPFVLLPIAEPMAPAVCCGTNANLRGDTNFVVEELLQIAASYPFDIYGCGPDFVDAQLREKPADARRLAERLIAFCPEMADFSDTSGSIQLIAEELSRTGRFGLWWD